MACFTSLYFILPWFYFTLLDSLAWLYLTVLWLYLILLHSTMLYFALLESTSFYHGSILLYFILQWLYFTLLESTSLYHCSSALSLTLLCFILLCFILLCMVLLHYTCLYFIPPWLYFTLPDSSSLIPRSYLTLPFLYFSPFEYVLDSTSLYIGLLHSTEL